MASYNAPINSTDNSSPWSDYTWDSRGFWVSSRRGPSGNLEYDYKYSETTAQTPRQEQATPRTPDADYIVQPQSLKYSYEASTASNYPSRAAQVQARYTTNPGGAGPSQDTQSYRVRPQSYDRRGSDHATSSVSGNSQAWSSGANLDGAGQDSQTYRTDDITGRMGRLDVNTAVPFQQQSYGTPQARQPNLGKQPHTASSSTGGGELDDRYKVVEDKNRQKFWKVGRVFMVLWTEPAGITKEKGTQNGSQFSTTYLNGTAYTEIRRFVVIGEGYGNSICSPIHTYSGQATLKSNLPDPKQHAIIYTSKSPPEEKSYITEDGTLVKENLPKEPIRVIPEQDGEEKDLGDLSRVNYAKIYTVEHYVRVLNIGKVHPSSMTSLERNCMFNRRSDEPPQPPRGQSSSSKRESKKNDSARKKSSRSGTNKKDNRYDD
ncbi:hypothetical protein IFR05_009380 [Cadophora sp. M221]|nr:hypothetical protein IFR05_009380 [Cadophora sp. M221]